MKKCSNCGELKPLSAFNKNHKAKDGLDYRCKQCTSWYQKKRRSDPTIHEQELERKRKWNDEHRELKRKKDLEQKNKKRFTGRVLGTSNIGQKLSRKYTGKPDFKREFKIIRREKNLLMKKGNKWLTLNCNARMNMSVINFYLREIERINFFNNQEGQFSLDFNNDEYVPFICPICHKGFVFQPVNPKSYEYTSEGMPIQVCGHCKTVINWSDITVQ